MANELFQYVATEQMISFSEENFNADVRAMRFVEKTFIFNNNNNNKYFVFDLIKTRNKILQKLKEPLKQKFTELNQALNTKVLIIFALKRVSFLLN